VLNLSNLSLVSLFVLCFGAKEKKEKGQEVIRVGRPKYKILFQRDWEKKGTKNLINSFVLLLFWCCCCSCCCFRGGRVKREREERDVLFYFFFVFILFFGGEFVFVGKKSRSDESEAKSL